MPEDLRKRLKDLVEHATHDKHMHEEEARSKAVKACMILKDHWEELIGSGSGPSKALVPERPKPDRGKLAKAMANIGVEVSILAKDMACAACGSPITGRADGYHHSSIRTPFGGVATHIKEPCCFAWLSFDKARGQFVDDDQ